MPVDKSLDVTFSLRWGDASGRHSCSYARVFRFNYTYALLKPCFCNLPMFPLALFHRLSLAIATGVACPVYGAANA